VHGGPHAQVREPGDRKKVEDYPKGQTPEGKIPIVSDKPPSLPTYQTGLAPIPDSKQAAPLMKMMGRMLAKKLPRLMNNPKVHSQNIKIKQKKVRYW